MSQLYDKLLSHYKDEQDHNTIMNLICTSKLTNLVDDTYDYFKEEVKAKDVSGGVKDFSTTLKT